MNLDKRDLLFIVLIMFGIAALIAIAHRPRAGENVAAVAVPDDTEIVGMSLAPETNPPEASPFKGRYPFQAMPFMSLNPTATVNGIEGHAPISLKDYH